MIFSYYSYSKYSKYSTYFKKSVNSLILSEKLKKGFIKPLNLLTKWNNLE